MKIIVISSAKGSVSEANIVNELFHEGMELFHLRKHNYSTKLLKEYIEQIEERYRDRIVLHTKHMLALQYNLNRIHITKKHKKRRFKTWLSIKYLRAKIPNLKISTSFHSTDSIKLDSSVYEYVFLSPVFDSISKTGYSGKFHGENMPKLLESLKQNVVALGGIDTNKLDQVYNLKYAGIAIHGALWQGDNPIQKFKEIQKACEQKNMSLV